MSFLYYYCGGDNTKIYVDLVIFLNIAMDFLLLLSVSIILKRNIKIYRIILGSIVGGISIIFLFISLNNFLLFIFKLLISILMVIVTFSFKNIKYFINNLLYLYLSSIILGGGLYLIDIQINYHNNGFIFMDSSFSINMVVLLFISPIIIYYYIKSMKKMKNKYNSFYKVDLYWNNKVYKFIAFLDTGNRLYDPYKHRPVILINSSDIVLDYDNSIIVPYKTASSNSILKCFAADKIVIDNNYEMKNILVGVSNKSFDIEGVNMLLHNDLIGGIK